MSGIGFPREADPELHDHYAKKLLIPGWSGEVSDAEAQYIAGELSKSARLRQAWGVCHFFGRRWKQISPVMAKRLCAAWAQNPTLGVKGLSIASGGKDKKQTMTESSGRTQLELISPLKDIDKHTGRDGEEQVSSQGRNLRPSIEP
jgi:hypothetical protein